MQDTKVGSCIHSILDHGGPETSEVPFGALSLVDKHGRLLETEELIMLV
jgi:hypothetical protein